MAWLDRWLVDTISYAEPSGISGGDPTWGTVTTATVRLEPSRQYVQSSGGQREQASHEMMTTTDIDERSRIWIDSASTSDRNNSYRILKKVRARDRAGDRTLYHYWLG